ncbi:phosphoenolpyruvate--protein phosphotransferase [Rhodococcus sp. IEGM 1409]|uniref:phosphoenolpyruvate--protein phosphotransferase n=1 Tax=Rhodococcus sp. IEGM 1409 TaxID=3047082 RepID=UPI0024B7BDA4|nr:phosphoenolpyruvate--protein phosphotransferase [Rhodococcus sp. IEGM 1409]MDI9903173.1 phosphoenolpyruvate--protein phosphotransferase [Rhodococcus sp. IEGM 1409]
MKTEEILTGWGVSRGVVCGPVLQFRSAIETADREAVKGTPAEESTRLTDAMASVAEELEQRASASTGVAVEILEMSAHLARDPDLAAAAVARVFAGSPATLALIQAVDEFCDRLTRLGGYMAERVADLRDVGNRTVARLLDTTLPGIPAPGHPFVLAAHDLSPADTATLTDSDVIALITEEGGPTSHTSILAKSLGIPAVVGCASAGSIVDGTVVIVDGERGTVEVAPDEERRQELASSLQRRQSTASGPGRTRDGHRVELLSNVGTLVDSRRASTFESEGIGLFRTEFVFLGRTESPDIDEQKKVYGEVFESFAGKPVTVRTLDAGSDKPLPFLGLAREENPALGIRGLRVAERHPQSLHLQLEALAAAQCESGAAIKVMAPMVSTADEARRFVSLARSYGLTSVGVMIEVPAAALRAADLFSAVDFVSIGTNDLAQYTFAADRMSHGLGHLLDPWQPAMLDLIALICEEGRSAGKPVGVCGEAASDPLMAAVLTGLGVSSLSMAPPSIACVREQLGHLDLDQCRRMASVARQSINAAEALTAVLDIAETASAGTHEKY